MNRQLFLLSGPVVSIVPLVSLDNLFTIILLISCLSAHCIFFSTKELVDPELVYCQNGLLILNPKL